MKSMTMIPTAKRTKKTPTAFLDLSSLRFNHHSAIPFLRVIMIAQIAIIPTERSRSCV